MPRSSGHGAGKTPGEMEKYSRRIRYGKSFLSDTDHIRYEETDLSFLAGSPCHFRCGIYMACVSGRCEVSTGAETFHLEPQTELIFLNGTLLHRLGATEDFRVRMIVFPEDVFLKAILPIDTPYMNYADEHPCYRHTPDARSQATWTQMCHWMDTAQMLFSGGYQTQFRDLQEYNFLQGLLLWLFNTVPEKLEVHPRFSRQQLLCQQFLQLVREYGTAEHSASFYAEKLCVSPRYLHRATSRCLEGRSPKKLIEEQLVAEVEVLLNDPDMTVTAIAEQLNFADQSYLTRFFKRHTGLSPKQYRSRKG